MMMKLFKIGVDHLSNKRDNIDKFALYFERLLKYFLDMTKNASEHNPKLKSVDNIKFFAYKYFLKKTILFE